MDNLELDPVGVEEEGRVVARRVVALPGLAVDLDALLLGPGEGPVDRAAIGRFEGEVMQADRIAIDRLVALALSLAQAERAVEVGAAEVADRLPALALLLDGGDPPQR